MTDRERRFDDLMRRLGDKPGVLVNNVLDLEAEVRALKATMKTLADLAAAASN